MENKWMLVLVLMTAVVMVFATGPVASGVGPYADAADQTGHCHVLLTDVECAAFELALTSMPPGEARNRLIDEYRLTVQDRESACNCNRPVSGEVLYPHIKQVALRL